MRFKLGTFSVTGGGAPFPGLVLEQTADVGMGGVGTNGTETRSTADRVVPFARLEPLLS
jgi:hypothetical protein